MIDLLISLGVNALVLGTAYRKVKREVAKAKHELAVDLTRNFQHADAYVTGLLSTVNDRLGSRLAGLETYWTEANSKNVDLIARRALMEEALSVPQKLLREASMARMQATMTAKPVSSYDQFHQRLVNGRPSG